MFPLVPTAFMAAWIRPTTPGKGCIREAGSGAARRARRSRPIPAPAVSGLTALPGESHPEMPLFGHFQPKPLDLNLFHRVFRFDFGESDITFSMSDITLGQSDNAVRA